MPTGWWIVDVLWRMSVYLGLVSWALAVAFSRLVIEHPSSGEMLTTILHPKVLSVVPYPTSGHLGLVYRRHLWHMLLHGGRNYPLRVAYISLGTCEDDRTSESYKHVVQGTRRMGCLG